MYVMVLFLCCYVNCVEIYICDNFEQYKRVKCFEKGREFFMIMREIIC